MHDAPARSRSRFPPLLLAVSVVAVPLAAGAAVMEPPVTTPMPGPSEAVPKAVATGEIQVCTSRGFTAADVTLDGLFKSRGEKIDYLKDAQTAPGTFSPQCGFTGQLVLRGGSCQVGLGWYNATANSTTPPAENEIYPLVPATIPKCPATPLTPDPTMMCCDETDFCPLALYDTTQAPQQHRWSMPPFSADNIRADKRYKGGLIGFVLHGKGAAQGTQCPQNKYSQLELNDKSPSGAPWIGSIVWQSTVDPSSYYLAFEDLPTATGTWKGMNTGLANDGDFNDFVFYISGVTCKGGGKPCDTGMMGICAAGVTQCMSGETITCTPVVKPSTEICDGIDNDCDGVVDQGSPCPNNLICDKGTCVGHCGNGEFQCAPGLVCDNDFCRNPACIGVTCETGQVCVNGTCQGGCEGVVCPHGQSCTAGFCIDLCRDVKCTGNQTCENGVCLPSCTCRGCDTGQVCADSGKCVESGCEKANCSAPAQFCMGGSCKDNCLGVICPGGQECTAGLCNPSVSTSMGTGGVQGTLKDAGSTPDVPVPSGSGGNSGSGNSGPSNGSSGSSGNGATGPAISACACETASSGGSATGLSFLIIGALVFLRRRRARG